MDEIRNVRLTLEYDGTDFCGWQIQKNVRTVQGTLEECLVRLLGATHRVVAASRTDAGAHARGQVASLYTRNALPIARIKQGLNALLPADVTVREASEVPFDFNARRSAKSRRYSYRVVVGPSALWRTRAWSIRGPLDLSSMEEASRATLGLRDFRPFSAGCEPDENTLCTVMGCRWREWPEGYLLEIEADRFVRYMIRTLAGTMIRLGEGRFSAVDFLLAFQTKVRPRLALTAPARGLCLEVVSYDGVSQGLTDDRNETLRDGGG